jgi:hypothetical protein
MFSCILIMAIARPCIHMPSKYLKCICKNITLIFNIKVKTNNMVRVLQNNLIVIYSLYISYFTGVFIAYYLNVYDVYRVDNDNYYFWKLYYYKYITRFVIGFYTLNCFLGKYFYRNHKIETTETLNVN